MQENTSLAVSHPSLDYTEYDFTTSNEDGSAIAKAYREEVAALASWQGDPLLVCCPSLLLSLSLSYRSFMWLMYFACVEVSRSHLDRMLRTVLTLPRNHEWDEENKEEVKREAAGYIWAKLGLLGFLTGAQTFQPRHGFDPTKKPPLGTNLIGVRPGLQYGTGEDRVVVVGAHWDTVRCFHNPANTDF